MSKLLKSFYTGSEVLCAKAIKEHLVTALDVASVSIFFLSLSTNKFKLFPTVEDVKGKFESDQFSSVNSDKLNRYIKEHKEIAFIENSYYFLYYRRKTCIALIEFTPAEINSKKEKHSEIKECLDVVIITLYNRKFTNNLFRRMLRPIDFQVIGEDDFYEEIINTIKTASGIELIALRELTNNKDLQCIGHAGFGKRDNSEFDFKNYNTPEHFKSAILKKETAYMEDTSKISWIQNNKLLKIVRSFIVIPIVVGTNVFGVLSFASKHKYQFSQTELLGFESIANGIGVAITNYRNFNNCRADIAAYSETAVALTGLEIAQASRHEAKNILEECQLIIADLISYPNQKINTKTDDLTNLSSKLLSIDDTLQKIKQATKPPIKKKTRIDIKEIWEQAVSQIAGRLSQLNINIQYLAKDVKIDGYDDWLRHAFLNLLLNSIDAFLRGGGGKKRGRSISLQLEKISEKSDSIILHYNDNAGGIDVHKLVIPDKLKGENMNTIIFTANVTSKGSEGSGWGLFLVRKSISHHMGSIDITRIRGGVTFKITLPKNF